MDLRNKRIVVTGGAGFLGSHVVARLADQQPAEVFVPRSARYDLTQREAVAQLYADTQPDVVYHLAAQVGGIGANQKNPGKYFHDNMAMGLHVIEEARKFGVSKIVFAGTICAYPKFAPIPFREDDLWNGYPEETNAPYGVAKKALLVMAQAYREQFGQNIVVALPVNLYGPRDNFDLESSHVIPAMIRKCMEAKRARAPEIVLWGDGSPTREFLYVDDCARALVQMAVSYDDPAPINLGSGHEVSIRALATLIAKLCGYDGVLRWDESRPNGQPRRCLDVSRAAERLGFRAETMLEEGLVKTIAWYSENQGAQG
jgi:GDP-L-fucose synthase